MAGNAEKKKKKKTSRTKLISVTAGEGAAKLEGEDLENGEAFTHYFRRQIVSRWQHHDRGMN